MNKRLSDAARAVVKSKVNVSVESAATVLGALVTPASVIAPNLMNSVAKTEFDTASIILLLVPSLTQVAIFHDEVGLAVDAALKKPESVKENDFAELEQDEVHTDSNSTAQ